MRSLTIALNLLLAAAPVYADISKSNAKGCLQSNNASACLISSNIIVQNRQTESRDHGIRIWTRDDASVIMLKTSNINAIKRKGSYGRYLEWIYTRSGTPTSNGSTWRVQGDCKEFTANWDQDKEGWRNLSNLEYLLKPRAKWGKWKAAALYEPAKEAQSLLKEFCPRMDQLVEQAKSRGDVSD